MPHAAPEPLLCLRHPDADLPSSAPGVELSHADHRPQPASLLELLGLLRPLGLLGLLELPELPELLGLLRPLVLLELPELLEPLELPQLLVLAQRPAQQELPHAAPPHSRHAA